MIDAILGGRVLTPSRTLAPLDVQLDGDRIAAVHPAGTLRPSSKSLSARGAIVSPGLIDTHVHGGKGVNFMELGDRAATVADHLAAGGVTACLATTASTDPDRQLSSLRDLAGRHDLDGRVELLGIHLEGPFLAPDQRGVHRIEHLRAPTRAEIDAILRESRGRLRVVTLAPELAGADSAIPVLVTARVTVSVGHSGTGFRGAQQAFQAGASRVTHCFNALPGIHHRRPGPVVAAIEDPGVVLEVIGDGLHVAPEVIAWLWRQVGTRRLVLVSDGVDVAGLADGRHRRWEGTEVVLRDGESRTAEGGLAGGTDRLAEVVGGLVHGGRLPLTAALSMASETAADSVGHGHRKGRLRPGYDADLVLLEETDLSVRSTIRAGCITYERTTGAQT